MSSMVTDVLLWAMLLCAALVALLGPDRSQQDDEASSSQNVELAAPSLSLAEATVPYSPWIHGVGVFVPAKDHGATRLLSSLDDWRKRQVEVDFAVLDAFWNSPQDPFAFHPQLYGFDGGRDFLSSMRAAGVKVVVWTSALVHVGCPAFAEGREQKYFLTDMNGRTKKFLWTHSNGAVIEGALVDFSSGAAVAWLRRHLSKLVELGVDGFRLGGVDGLLADAANVDGRVLGSKGYYEPRKYSADYYRVMLDIGRRAGGFNFFVIGRAVDTFGRFAYHQFAPHHALMAGWVGDHALSVRGFRESVMNALHSAALKFPIVGVVIPKFGSASAGRMYDDTGDVSEEDESVSCIVDCHNEKMSLEVWSRWAEFGGFLPFVCHHSTQALTPEAEKVALSMARTHQSLAPYFASAATGAFLRTTDHPQPLKPTSPRSLYFDDPLDWGLRVGRDLVVVPVVYSAGDHSVVHVTLPSCPTEEEELNASPPSCGGEWTRWTDITAVIRHGTSSMTANSTRGEQLMVFRRRGSVVPLLLGSGANAAMTLSVENPVTTGAVNKLELPLSIGPSSSWTWRNMRASFSASKGTVTTGRSSLNGVLMRFQIASPELSGSLRDFSSEIIDGVVRPSWSVYVAADGCRGDVSATCGNTTCITETTTDIPRDAHDRHRPLPDDMRGADETPWCRLFVRQCYIQLVAVAVEGTRHVACRLGD